MWISSEKEYFEKQHCNRSRTETIELAEESFIKLCDELACCKTIFISSNKATVRQYVIHKQREVDTNSLKEGRNKR